MADDDLETADAALDPAVEPNSATAWLALITRAEKAFDSWQSKSDNIDKLYANLERLASTSRDREFQLFWANVQVLGPSIYSRPPIPVVTTRFKDRKPIPRTASEMLERSCVVTFEAESIDETMKLVRDDMTTVARGQIWVRYEAKTVDGVLTQTACIDHANRKDFLHDPARTWKEVDWVAKRSWLTRKEARKRFRKTSGDAYADAAYEVRKDEANDDNSDGRLKAGFWELWSKSANKVVWVAEGVDKLLDEGKPHLKLEGFFPCPRPAYGTTQRNSLIPVPDVLFYKDQLEEINEITARIASLTESLRLKGFYPGGATEISDAIEAALKSTDNRQVLVPVSNWAALGGAKAADMILWLPLDMVASTIQQLIELRKQLIDDVYQITGLSDIMRGSTVASETLGAQELKSQYGSIRIRDRQEELIRIARDVTRIVAEIMAENFSGSTLLAMSQLDIPSDADIARKVKELETQAKQQLAELQQALSDPEVQAKAQQNPQQAQQAQQKIKQQVEQQAQQLQAEIGKLKETVTIEKVMKFLRDNRVRSFTLDIETDSTIAPDENAQKQRATEYTTAMTGFLQQVVPAVQAVPQIAPLAADMIRFVNSQFRVGRQFEQTVEEFTDQMKQMAAAPKNEGPTPEQIQAQADQQKSQLEAMKMQADARSAQADAQIAAKDLELKTQVAAKDAQIAEQQLQLDKYKADKQAETAITVAQIKAGQDDKSIVVDAANAEADRQHEAALMEREHGHQLEVQGADQAHQAELQHDAQSAAAEQAEMAE